MRGAAWVAAIVVAATGAARADDDDLGPPRLSATLEVAVLTSPARGARSDVASWAAIVPRFHWHFRPTLALTVGVGVPIPPLVATHLPVGLEWTPLGGRRGPVLRAHLRPVWSSLDRCGAGGDCPFDDAFDPSSRAAGVIGGMGDIGAGYRVAVGQASLEVAVAYTTGYLVGSGVSNVFESPIEGIYQGVLVELGLVH